jgi:hypothetical protein
LNARALHTSDDLEHVKKQIYDIEQVKKQSESLRQQVFKLKNENFRLRRRSQNAGVDEDREGPGVEIAFDENDDAPGAASHGVPDAVHNEAPVDVAPDEDVGPDTPSKKPRTTKKDSGKREIPSNRDSIAHPNSHMNRPALARPEGHTKDKK